ncbi:MAG: 50S ribosomal protein L6 [Candidatus Levybacteria bacterium RIFCSPLOWO2_01_FULL_36_13]|nr:MAG: 50S ribosomal protein L6 [Candidatus Levybacteria bacterium RIFCSPHIGHO2_01_FULL_36_15b]OGH35028.1 MAG: 50S ribosomal protein L6 [Candidatus Levybacteria bacterium RIFCSPLOWO2_01_FULL_36_13]
MSKIAKKPIIIKEGVTLINNGGVVTVSGPKGSLVFNIPTGVETEINDGKVMIRAKSKNPQLSPMLGLTRALLANFVTGVSEGFEKKLELAGVGYRAQATGDTLTLSVGFSHPVIIKGEPGITFSVEENIITVSGIDKILVGNTAAKVRNIRPPEPYKGKGIKYVGERIRRKAGKAAKALTGAGGAK